MLLHQIEKDLPFLENSLNSTLVNFWMDLCFNSPSDFMVYSEVPQALCEYSPRAIDC